MSLQKIGKYLLLAEQERTTLGTIWRAADLVNGKISKHLLIDVIDPNLAADPGFLDHYLNQSLIAAKLEHPNILRKVTSIHEGGRLSSIYEYQEGFTLARVLERCQADMFPFSIDHGLLVVSKLLSALAYAKTKHLTHGFVNPHEIFVTHEGEIKLKGFAFSSSLRACTLSPQLDPSLSRYIPEGRNLLSGDQDKLDIFGCGAILFEMLVGESFKAQKGDAQAIIAKAQTAADGEAIPAAIAGILIKSLDIGRANAYKDSQAMAKEMDELLFSGEYSPTTFNLAFFMHSAFREEMEAMGEKIAREKEINYGHVPPPLAKSAAAPPVAAAAGAPSMPPIKIASKPEREVRVTPGKKSGGSKLPLILGAVGLLAVVAVLVVFFVLPRTGSKTSFDREADKLRAEGEAQQEKFLAEEEEDKDREIELLREALARERQLKAEQEKKALEEEMLKMDEEITRLNTQKDQERRAQDLEEKLKLMQQEKAVLAQREQEARDEAEKARKEAIRLAKEKEAKAAPAETEAAVADSQTGDSGALKEQNQPGGDAGGVAADAKTSASPDDPAKLLNPPAKSKKDSVAQVPMPGDIVDADDQYLTQPIIESNPPVLEIPRKAIKDGVIKRDSVITFLMKILVDENGKIEEVEIYRSPKELSKSETDYGMTEKAVRTAKKLRYSPPNKMGVNVKVWMYVAVHFQDK